MSLTDLLKNAPRRPITEAPKDGCTVVLCRASGEAVPAYWSSNVSRFVKDDDGPAEFIDDAPEFIPMEAVLAAEASAAEARP